MRTFNKASLVISRHTYINWNRMLESSRALEGSAISMAASIVGVDEGALFGAGCVQLGFCPSCVKSAHSSRSDNEQGRVYLIYSGEYLPSIKYLEMAASIQSVRRTTVTKFGAGHRTANGSSIFCITGQRVSLPECASPKTSR
jgi:hypothetical protein